MTGPDSALVAGVAGLAVYRATILVVADKLTEPVRRRLVDWLNHRKHGPRPESGLDASAWVTRRYQDPHRLAYLLQCPWCASYWVALLVTAGTVRWGGCTAWWLVCGPLAGSGLASILASRYSPED